jgi:arabinose-5-phosphate isomerase
MDDHSADDLLNEARRVLQAESRAIEGLIDRLGDRFVRAVGILSEAKGRVIVSGIGKSGIIGRKIAATLTSTGTPATYLHPVESLHGDLGIVSRDDAAILISKSGDTSELAGLIDYLIRQGVPIVAMTGVIDSALGKAATVALDCSVDEEACPLDLAPTTSTTATLALGDALAVVLLEKNGFQAEDFARLHPGGSLGRKLTMKVEEVMVGEGYPSLGVDSLMRDCIVPLADMRGTVPIVDEARHVVGVVTAGDLTRLMERTEDFLDVPVRDVMTPTPKLIRVGELASAAVHLMEKHGIMALPVVDREGCLEGILHLHDLMRSGAL